MINYKFCSFSEFWFEKITKNHLCEKMSTLFYIYETIISRLSIDGLLCRVQTVHQCHFVHEFVFRHSKKTDYAREILSSSVWVDVTYCVLL